MSQLLTDRIVEEGPGDGSPFSSSLKSMVEPETVSWDGIARLELLAGTDFPFVFFLDA